MSNRITWLAAEIDRWTSEQIITPEQAGRLRALYHEPGRETRPWGLIVFSGIGAVVVGLGVILLFAYNWAAMPKAAKLGTIFGAIIAAHGTGLYLLRHYDWRQGVGEALALLGSMLFGAGIWLVAQIYHINEHFPNGFLIWGLGALGLAWILPSLPQALLATVVLTIWATSEHLAFGVAVPIALPLLLVGLGPLIWRLGSAILLAALLISFYLLLPMHGSHGGGGAGGFLGALAWSVALIALARLAPVLGLGPRSQRLLTFFGMTGFLVCGVILSFPGAGRNLLQFSAHSPSPPGPFLFQHWGLFTASVVAWVFVVIQARRSAAIRLRLDDALYPLLLLLAFLFAHTGPSDGGWPALVANVVVLSVATVWIMRGCREGRLGAVIVGSTVVAVVMLARYFDLFDSLVARGLAFVLFGLLLFGEGLYYRRMRQAGVTEDAA